MRYRFAVTSILVLACTSAWADDTAEDLVTAYIEAWNAHDVERMMKLVADDVKWWEIADGQAMTANMGRTEMRALDADVRTKNSAELRQMVESYFDTFRGARSIIRDMNSSDPFVTTFEEAVWNFAGVPMSQCAAAIYEIRNGVIANVWYSSEQPCDDESPSG